MSMFARLSWIRAAMKFASPALITFGDRDCNTENKGILPYVLDPLAPLPTRHAEPAGKAL
jgi:hypothetical protein